MFACLVDIFEEDVVSAVLIYLKTFGYADNLMS